MRSEVPDYDRLHDALVAATLPVRARAILDLGTGTGESARRVLNAHPGAHLVGIDAAEEMLALARRVLPSRSSTLLIGRIEDPLPPGPFDLVVSAVAVHHLDDAGKAALFRRVGAALATGGRFALADVGVADDPGDAVTPLSAGYDLPSSAADQLRWLREAGLLAQPGGRVGTSPCSSPSA